jgi:hypothetical protein
VNGGGAIGDDEARALRPRSAKLDKIRRETCTAHSTNAKEVTFAQGVAISLSESAERG